MFKFIHKIRQYFADESARCEKLELMFQTGRTVRNRESGKEYQVLDSDLCFALLQAPEGTHFCINWLTPAGTIITDVADRWDPVTA